MSYSSLYFRKNKKIYPYLGMLAFLSVIVGALFFVRDWGIQNGWQKAAGIDKMYVVNRSPTGFELIWSTKENTTDNQWVEVGVEKGAFPIKVKPEQHNGIYYSKVKGLNPDTPYQFRVRVGTRTYILPDLVPETVHTPKELKESPISPAYGKVLLSSTKPYAGGMLIYEVDGYYPLAVFTKETGEWLLPLTGLIEKKNNLISSVGDSTQVSIRLLSYPGESIRTTVGRTRPLKQAIIAGKTLYLAKSMQDDLPSVLGTSAQTENVPKLNPASITYPKENALIPGNTPLIRGTAPIGKDVLVFIQAPTRQLSYRAKTNEKGDWLVQYPLILDPGKYTIVVTVENNTGSPTVIRRNFSIIKSGEQVMGVATGTPTLAPTSPPVPTYANPTSSPNPTAVPTTATYPTTALTQPLTPTPPVTGGGISGFLFGALFCIVIGAGLVLAF